MKENIYIFILWIAMISIPVGLFMVDTKSSIAQDNIPIANKDRFTIENLTKEDDPVFTFLITDKKTQSEFLYIRSAGGSSCSINLNHWNPDR